MNKLCIVSWSIYKKKVYIKKTEIISNKNNLLYPRSNNLP